MTLATADNPPRLNATSRRRAGWKRHVLGALISFVCLGFIAWRIDLDEFLKAIAGFQWGWLILGFSSLAMGYAARIVRWSSLLRAAGAHVPFSKCAAPFLGSIALNNVLPMRLGDVIRALVFPAAIGIGRTAATGSLVMERLVDLMTLLACLAVGLAVTSRAQLPEWLVGSTVGLAIMGTIALILIFFFSGELSRWFQVRALKMLQPKWQKVMHVLSDLLGGFAAMSRLSVLLGLFALSVIVWAGEAGLFWALLKGFGLDAGMGAAVVVMAIATLSTLVPSSPGYVGPFHLAAFSAISMLGGTSAQAASFAVLAHLGVWLPTTVAGALAILFNPQLFGKAKALADQDS